MVTLSPPRAHPLGLREIPTTLILDFDDSYTRNLLVTLNNLPDNIWNKKSIRDRVLVINVYSITWDQLVKTILPSTDCIILGPGPGTPELEKDFSWNKRLIEEFGGRIPIFGLCLGLQGIATTFGGRIIKSPSGPRHGQITPISHSNSSPLFKDVPTPFDAVQYNSLVVDPATLPDSLEVVAWDEQGAIMALSHKSKKIWGVQFHPESISSTFGPTIISNFLSLSLPSSTSATSPPFPPPLQPLSTSYTRGLLSNPIPDLPKGDPKYERGGKMWDVKWVALGKGKGRIPTCQEVFEGLMLSKKDELGEIWLDSARPAPSNTPQYSHLLSPQFILSYSLSNDSITIHHQSPSSSSSSFSTSHSHSHTIQLSPPRTFFTTLGTAQMNLKRLTSFGFGVEGEEEGMGMPLGFVGYVGYEMKEVSLGTRSCDKEKEREKRADSEFAFCSLLLSFDHEAGNWFAGGLVRSGGGGEGEGEEMERRLGVRFGVEESEWEEWLAGVEKWFEKYDSDEKEEREEKGETGQKIDLHLIPDQDRQRYLSSIHSAQSSILLGESYELCLTTQFRSTLPPNLTPYQLYLSLRTSNPAPYSSYFHLRPSSLHLLSSSPEKFMSITSNGKAEMKPIKGTSLRNLMDEKEDERIRRRLEEDKKERAENLMIVDLCRNDLLGFCQVGSVQVPKLMVVETYQTVHQLVTSVQGQLSPAVNPFEAVSRAFPPGSMTGAPKLRSVKLLEELEEHKPRGIYSGVFGFVAIDGTTDFSVVIRTLVIRDDEITLGAGGAITHLSNAESEWDEVLVKKNAVVGKLVVQKSEVVR